MDKKPSNNDSEESKARKACAQLSIDKMMGFDGTVDTVNSAKEPSDENNGDHNERFLHHPDDEFTSSEDEDYAEGEDDDELDRFNEIVRSNNLDASNESHDSHYSPCSSFLVYRLATLDIEPPPDSSAINSKTIEACISSLSSENGNSIATANQVILQITEGSIVLIDLKTKQLMVKVNISKIISWAACDRDFAFVTCSDIIIGDTPRHVDSSDLTSELAACAITPQSSKYYCHVFRCEDDGLESAAVTISLLLEKEKVKSTTESDGFYIEDDYLNPQSTISTPDVEFFPTPVEEPCKTIRAIFLGSVVVTQPSGIEVLNGAIDSVVNQLHNQKCFTYENTANSDDEENEESASVKAGASQHLLRSRTWTLSPCDVKISPSTVLIAAAISGETIVDARLRYISFMGISRSDVRKCAFILRTGESEFTAFILQCDPDAGLLCRTLETACKMRFQKCMDAHRLRSSASTDAASSSNRTFGVFKRSTSLQAVKKAISNVLWNK